MLPLHIIFCDGSAKISAGFYFPNLSAYLSSPFAVFFNSTPVLPMLPAVPAAVRSLTRFMLQIKTVSGVCISIVAYAPAVSSAGACGQSTGTLVTPCR
jgi:hypothetical protein